MLDFLYKKRMPEQLCDSVAECVGKTPESVRAIVIHLRRATERLPLVEQLIGAVGPLMVWDAADGAALVAGGHPTPCGMDPGVVRTAGEVGCMVSHITAMQKALADGISHLVVFEDDCVPAPGFSLNKLRDYLQKIKQCSTSFSLEAMNGLILLGTCGCYRWKQISPGLKATDHFNGSHAYSIGREMMAKVVHTYLQFLAQGKTAPIDGLLPLLLQAEKLHAFCPEEDTGLFAQNRAIPSYVVSNGENLRTG